MNAELTILGAAIVGLTIAFFSLIGPMMTEAAENFTNTSWQIDLSVEAPDAKFLDANGREVNR